MAIVHKVAQVCVLLIAAAVGYEIGYNRGFGKGSGHALHEVRTDIEEGTCGFIRACNGDETEKDELRRMLHEADKLGGRVGR